MSNSLIQIVVLAAIAVFLVMRLRNVLGTREGFEPPRQPVAQAAPRRASVGAEPEGSDVLDHAAAGSAAAAAAVGITVEPDSGSEQPTSEPIALFDLTQAT